MAEYVAVAKEGDLAPGQSMCVIVKGRRVALFNVDGTVYAINDICSHADASLSEGEFEGHVVVCPRHGARFDVKSGAALSLPAWAPVDSYQVKVEDGEIKVAL